MSVDAVRAQYEALPYPTRDPRDEAKRLIAGSPGDLAEIRHYLFGGRLEFGRPFRALFAGGGTGDGAIMLAQQAVDAGLEAEIVHLDLSEASQAVARARAAARNLTNLRFVQGSLLDVAELAPGPWDYIDSCGVLHHLPDPDAGLAALAAALSPQGGMGIMVYGEYGRAGVYHMQDALRTLAGGLPDDERLDLARRLLAGLPPTNQLRRNPMIADHLRGDAGLYDLLLHSQDRAYAVPQLVEFVRGTGLEIVTAIEPAAYDPTTWIRDPKLLKRLDGLDWAERAALAERVLGSMNRHVVYLKPAGRADDPIVRLDGAAIPILHRFDPKVAAQLKPGQTLTAQLFGAPVPLALPRLAPAILARIDGARPVDAIYRELNAAQGSRLTRAEFDRQLAELYRALNGINKMLLRR